MVTPHRVLVCHETPCVARGAVGLHAAFRREIDRLGLDHVSLEISGCHGHGLCSQGPSVVVEPSGFFYNGIQPPDAEVIVREHLSGGRPVQHLFHRDPVTGRTAARYADVDFFRRQRRVALRNCGRINPEKIEHYVDRGGYGALQLVLSTMRPEDVIELVEDSGLRGRGGAGFPTGRKWRFARRSSSDVKYVVCNADEGNPGAFTDRSVLEGDPHAVVEGMIIAGYAVGARRGYLYIRAEYPLAVRRVQKAIEDARDKGFLGSDLLGSGFSFDLEIKEGAGAFVCGEETALLASIQSRRGMPRPRPPFPTDVGLGGKPTVINNVKTLAFVPVIVDRGPGWFSSLGTPQSAGTAVFALTGNIRYSGLVEVPMGTPLAEIIDIGGGIPDGRKVKAVHTGGPAGGSLPADRLDAPVDYEALQELGSTMGSGGMLVLDEDACMVDVARFFMDFACSESCGQCAPCRLGTGQMVRILTRIATGRGAREDLVLLREVADTVKHASLCGLGQTCSNPVLATLEYFKEEYLAHIREGKCPLGVCEVRASVRPGEQGREFQPGGLPAGGVGANLKGGCP